jgi:hypothetical protein
LAKRNEWGAVETVAMILGTVDAAIFLTIDRA